MKLIQLRLAWTCPLHRPDAHRGSQNPYQIYSPSRHPFTIFVAFGAETLPESPLSRAHLKAGCQGLGSWPLGNVGSPLRRLSCRSVLTHLLSWHSSLAFPTGSLSTEKENSVLLSESHRGQDKSICRGEKKSKNKVCKFCRQLFQAPDISCPRLSCLQLLPEVFAILVSVLEEVVSLLFGDCGHQQQLENSLGLRSFSFTCLLHRAVTIRKAEPPGWVSPALSCTKLGKFNQQLLRDSASSGASGHGMEWPKCTLSSSS